MDEQSTLQLEYYYHLMYRLKRLCMDIGEQQCHVLCPATKHLANMVLCALVHRACTQCAT